MFEQEETEKYIKSEMNSCYFDHVPVNLKNECDLHAHEQKRKTDADVLNNHKGFTCGFCQTYFCCENLFSLHVQEHFLKEIKSEIKTEPVEGPVDDMNEYLTFAESSDNTSVVGKKNINTDMSSHKLSLNVSSDCRNCIKPFACDKCHYATAQKSNLVRHLRTHSAEKPCVCAICDYAAAQKSTLVTHMKTHTGEKPFECDKCEFSARHKRNLVKHMKTHTGERPQDIIAEK